MEAERRNEELRCLLEYAQKLGFFDQMDMFDDTATTLDKIVKSLGKSKGPRPVDQTVDELTQH